MFGLIVFPAPAIRNIIHILNVAWNIDKRRIPWEGRDTVELNVKTSQFENDNQEQSEKF